MILQKEILISNIILNALEHNKIHLKNGDIILIAQTIISKSNGRIRNLKEIKPTEKAISIYNNITSIALPGHIRRKRSLLAISNPFQKKKIVV